MYSEYFEKEIELTADEQETLLDLYEEIAKERHFEPDYDDRRLVDLMEDSGLLDTVLYHVDTFGKELEGFSAVEHLFESEEEVEIGDMLVFDGDNELFEVKMTGRNYDFIANIWNATDKDLCFEFDEELGLDGFEVPANDWVGILADEDGRRILKAIADEKYTVEARNDAALKSKMLNCIYNNGWEISDCDIGPSGDFGWELSKYSPAGEDFSIAVAHNGDMAKAIEEIRECGEDFDTDEHIEMWIEARHNGVGGVPSTRELVEDADAIKAMILELADALETVVEAPDLYTFTPVNKDADILTTIHNHTDNTLRFSFRIDGDGIIEIKAQGSYELLNAEENCDILHMLEKGEFELVEVPALDKSINDAAKQVSNQVSTDKDTLEINR